MLEPRRGEERREEKPGKVLGGHFAAQVLLLASGCLVYGHDHFLLGLLALLALAGGLWGSSFAGKGEKK